MPLQRRLPKRGFKNPFKKEYTILNLKDIDRIGLDTITPEVLKEKGIIRSLKDGFKVLGDGEISRSVTVKANAISSSAARKIQDAGGSVEVI
jgi:large subunit ribosomal protein L15